MKMFPNPRVPENPQVPLIDNSFAPEFLSSGVAGLSLINSIITVTLESVRCDHSKEPPPLERIVVARIALSVPAAQALLVAMHQFLDTHGVNPLTIHVETRQ